MIKKKYINFLFSQALVHVSTAYCNPQLKNIPEEVNNLNGDPVGIVELCKVSYLFITDLLIIQHIYLENGCLTSQQSGYDRKDYWKQTKHLHFH